MLSRGSGGDNDLIAVIENIASIFVSSVYKSADFTKHKINLFLSIMHFKIHYNPNTTPNHQSMHDNCRMQIKTPHLIEFADIKETRLKINVALLHDNNIKISEQMLSRFCRIFNNDLAYMKDFFTRHELDMKDLLSLSIDNLTDDILIGCSQRCGAVCEGTSLIVFV